jgi:hypothetical protein
MNKTNNELLNKNDFTLTHLESQLNASIGLNSPKEFKFWLMTYARYVVENSNILIKIKFSSFQDYK